MKSKRVAKWEHKISQNIKATEHLVRQEVSKDLNFLRRLLNEVNFMKVKVSRMSSLARIEFGISLNLKRPHLGQKNSEAFFRIF